MQLLMDCRILRIRARSTKNLQIVTWPTISGCSAFIDFVEKCEPELIVGLWRNCLQNENWKHIMVSKQKKNVMDD